MYSQRKDVVTGCHLLPEGFPWAGNLEKAVEVK